MEIKVVHELDCDLGAALDSLVSAEYPAFLASQHRFFRDVRVLALVSTASGIRRYLRYEASPPFANLGPFSIPPAWFVWNELSDLDLRTHTLTFENVPELESIRPKVINRGVMRFRSLPNARCERASTFEIDLRVSGVLRAFVDLGIELVAKQVKRSLDEEAEVLSRWARRSDARRERAPIGALDLPSARALN